MTPSYVQFKLYFKNSTKLHQVLNHYDLKHYVMYMNDVAKLRIVLHLRYANAISFQKSLLRDLGLKYGTDYVLIMSTLKPASGKNDTYCY